MTGAGNWQPWDDLPDHARQLVRYDHPRLTEAERARYLWRFDQTADVESEFREPNPAPENAITG